MFYLLMTPLALADGKGALSVMTFSAELILIEVVHLHAGSALFVFEDTCVAVGAFEHGCMQLVAEYRWWHIARRITEVLFQGRHVVALRTVFGGECDPSVMASAAVAAFIHLIHDDVRSSLLHLEELWMALAATVFFRMVLMGESHGHA